MKNYKQALKSIQEVKQLVKGLSFDDAAKQLGGYNCDGDLFDYDYGNITGTVWNENGKAFIHEDSTYDVIDDEWEYISEPIEYNISEHELEKRAGNSVSIGRNEIEPMSYEEMNYFECIDDGD